MTTMMMDAEKDGKPLPMVNGKVGPDAVSIVFCNCSMMSRPSRDRSVSAPSLLVVSVVSHLKRIWMSCLESPSSDFGAPLQFDYTKDFFQKPAFLTVSGQR